jgi:hypothetical protein
MQLEVSAEGLNGGGGQQFSIFEDYQRLVI